MVAMAPPIQNNGRKGIGAASLAQSKSEGTPENNDTMAEDTFVEDYRPTSPGHSPGVGHEVNEK